jgi:hypothetical protein
LELPVTKAKDPRDLVKTGKPWSPEDERRVNRVFQMTDVADGPTYNRAIEIVLGRKPGEKTLVGTTEWRRLHRLVKTARNMAEKAQVDIPYRSLTPEDFRVPENARAQMIAFAKRLATKYVIDTPPKA